jgi:hypothetical protein
LQEKILSLLHIPKEIYGLSFITAQVQQDHDPIEDPVDLAIV